jgi:hypothetical protein
MDEKRGSEQVQHFTFIGKLYTDKKEKQVFLIYKEIQSGAVAKSYVYY